jgi:uncharacterized membrane protein/mono/diheme cytochrome c family protein
MTDTLYFLGRFHVLLLHLPIGILLLAVVLEVASRRERFRHLAAALDAVWVLGALAAIGTAVLGYLHASEGGFDSAAINAHRIAGTSLAIVATLVAVARARFASFYAIGWPVASIAIVALVFVTGHFGGNLTHGDTYLAEYAPGFLRSLMGVSEEQVPRPAPKNLAAADIYLDVVAPAFRQRCHSCHNDSKKKGGLSLASYAALMKGGEKGPVIAAGQPDKSDLVRRISLAHGDADFMPQDGKTPLSREQTAAIRWWVAAGAPHKGTVLALGAPKDVQLNIEVALRLRAPTLASAEAGGGTGGGRARGGDARDRSGEEGRSADSSADVANGLPDLAANVPPADVAALDDLERKGFAVRAIAVGSPLLQVDYTANRPLTDEGIAALGKIAQQIRILNLREAGLTDAQLKPFARFENLAQLRLELNPVTDAGLAALSGLGKLEYLNLYGTHITNASLKPLGALPRLRELFVWETAVTPAAVEEFRRAHAQVRVTQGFDPKSFPEGPKVIPVVN